MSVNEVKQIPKSVCNRNQARKALPRHFICLTDSRHYFIFDKIKLRDDIECKRDMSFDDNEK